MKSAGGQGDRTTNGHRGPWGRCDRTSAATREPLTYDRIAAAAIELADSDGLAAVSMRRLAENLGVTTMAPYRYISGKDDLFETMVDTVHEDVALPVPGTGWAETLRSYAEQLRRVTVRHPWLVQIYARLPGILTPRLAELSEQVLASMDTLEIDADARIAMLTSVTAYAQGAAAAEVARKRQMSRSAYHPYRAELIESGRYPRLVDYVVNGSDQDTADQSFGFGLDCLIHGMGADVRGSG
ncbi:TetR/AcrR family transcriptional regulator [Nocardia sp. NPDC020380]|uniref:TetR/AcrR family transcriptional regulator n=1 Tax=Nocardia sp. NPDC020380 TaxID=3364309 RepID=UPI0037A05D07